MQMPVNVSSNLDLIGWVFAPLIGHRLLDVGCGSGSLVGALRRRGAIASGIDPNGRAVTLARARFPEADLRIADAAALPFGAEEFDGVILQNSLHHIAPAAIDAALGEARRVTRARGHTVILEPLARGPYHEVMAAIDDETEVRAAALDALGRFVASGQAREVMRHEYDVAVRVDSAEALIAEAVRVDARRRDRAEAARARVHNLFEQHRQVIDGRSVLYQPMVAAVLARA